MSASASSHRLALRLAPWLAFIRQPEALDADVHAELRLRPGDFSFASGAQLIPILLSELPVAVTTHPIVVTAAPAPGLAVVAGREPGCNLHVNEGRWLRESYVPYAARLYPFAPAADVGSGGAIPLVADLAAPHLSVGGSGQPLFVDGRPGPALAPQLLAAHRILQDVAATAAFAEALVDHGIAAAPGAPLPGPLEDIPLGDDARRIDPRALARLPDDAVVTWHRHGWLAACVLILQAERHAAVLSAIDDGRRARARGPEAAFAPSSIV